MNLSDSTLVGMRKTNELFCSTAIGLRDMSVLDHIYTAEAHILPPGADMIHGMPAIKSFWLQAVTGLDVKQATLATVSAEAVGDDVVEIGRAELTLTDGRKVPIKYVVHWKLEGAAWKWHTDIWNLNQ
ncbi:MAG TPA: nuclear transport factor 2 family protein [Acidobacteriaceae bacterium]|nr:nuclear transport factor 2 family protein [Acidobacteriaceae bacterium]